MGLRWRSVWDRHAAATTSSAAPRLRVLTGTMIFRRVVGLRSQTRVLANIEQLRLLSTSIASRAKKDVSPKDPMKKRDSDTKPYAAEQTRSGRHEDVAKKDTAFDPSTTDPKQQKHQETKEEGGSLDVSPAEESVSKDYDKADEEVASSRYRGDPSIFVKSPNHQEESVGDISESNTSREKYRALRKDQSEEPKYYKP